MPSFFIETFGCQMNKSDSELMEISLESAGFTRAAASRKADIVIFNTCSVRQNAEDRATARIREARAHLPKGGVLVLAGCMAQRTGDAFLKKKWADIVVGPYQSPHVGELVKEIIGRKKSALSVSQEPSAFIPRLDPALAERAGETASHRWVTITHGCGNFCTYCIVPYVRGKLISFSSESILSYIKKLSEKGIREVTLLGQNVNQYGQDNGDIPFYQLLEKTAQTAGIDRVNFLTSHPKDFCIDTIRVIKNNPNISRGIHLPLQSGSNDILKRMNRQYTREHYLSIIENIERELSEYAVTTDLIVGFPGETEKDFEDTLSLVKRVRFSDAFTYAYSPREGTAAAGLNDNIPHDEKIRRLNELITVQREIISERRRERIGRTEQIIVECVNDKNSNDVVGKNILGQTVIFPGDASDPGTMLNVRITGVKGATLLGDACR